jgi:ABC-type uncharacterized transport system fused permease/ATPase subunit
LGKISGKLSTEITNMLGSCLKNILENVRLNYLLEREGGWDANMNWEDTLSLGEQQRLGMVRKLMKFKFSLFE